MNYTVRVHSLLKAKKVPYIFFFFFFSREEYFFIAIGGVEPVRIKPSYVLYGQRCDMHMGEKGVREGVVDIQFR